MKLIPSLLQLVGTGAVLGAVWVLVGPWSAVGLGGAAIAVYGYWLEANSGA